ncbi:Rne/Rng family ribonuclease [Epibacterium sp. SM1969]|uniref:Ribonuclease E n=1 Tax=Tritonibacter aquimaris TaxID=2663379 RepID=A0A844ATE9_9RHOB|nr:ribonuclease E/G [Tritonibacter aquimaris]MQY41301.1 Rne/Rng family ribonuclease [Tritonibacter aquimaris]
MAKKMLIDATHAEETRVVVVDGNKVEEFDFESENKRQLAGNIYLAKVTRVEPSLQAAFVDYGGNRHGFLAFSEIHPDYYQIPVADREALMEEERAYAEAMRAQDDDEEAKPQKSRRKRGGRSKAAKATSSDVVETKDVSEDALEPAQQPTEIAGMETIDLTDDTDVVSDEASSPMERVAETPVEEPQQAADVAADDQPAEVVAEAAETDDAVAVSEAPAETAPAETTPAETSEDATDAPAEAVSDEAVAEEAASEKVAPEEAAAEETASEEAAAEVQAEDTAAPDAVVAEAETVAVAEAETAASEEADETSDKDAAEGEEAADDNIESVADEDDSEDIRPPRKPRPRRYKIQEVIKVRQVLLVQVVKEERGNKGAALTTYLSLAGRYCVLMPNTARGGGISRKITNAVDRKKLKEIANEMDVPTGAGLIIRTAGAKRTKAEVKRDYEYLQRLWEQIRELTLKSIAPAKIYEEGDLIKRSIRDLYNREIDEVLVEGERGYRIAKDFMKMIMPSHAKNVKNYQEALPLFARYQVESYLGGMFNPVVQLKSGGYIVIGVTEALVAIDVNSGRATKESSIEETALKTNLEAAEEVARQLRLRDLAGLIVIDFIDMDERKNNAAVEKRMKDKLKTDRARIQVGRISGFGLMEMSRQRLRPGMIEATTQPCPHCHGTGLIRSDDSLALSILRQIEEEGTRGRSREVLVKCPVEIANYLMNNKREHIAQIEARYGLSVRIEGDPHLVSPDFSIEKFKTASRVVPMVETPVVSVDTKIMDEVDAIEEEEEVTTSEADAPAGEDEEQKPKRRRRRRRRRKSTGEEGAEQKDADAVDGEAAEDAAEQEDDAEEKTSEEASEAAPKEEKKRRSRSRSRRRKKDQPSDEVKVADQGEDTPAEGAGEPAAQDEAEVTPQEAPVEDAAAEAVEASAEPSELVEAVAEGAAEDAPVEAASVDPVAEEASADEVAVEEAAVEETVAEEPAADEVAVEDVVSSEDENVAEAAAEPVQVNAAEADEAPVETAVSEEVEDTQTEAPAEEAVTEDVATPVLEAVGEPAEPAAPPKPKKRGWWSK